MAALVSDASRVLKELSIAAGHECSIEDVTVDDLRAVFSALDPTAVVDTGEKFLWIESMASSAARSRGVIDALLGSTPPLDDELASLLRRLDACEYFSVVEHAVTVRVANPDLLFLTRNFHEYCVRVRDLKRYAAAGVRTTPDQAPDSEKHASDLVLEALRRVATPPLDQRIIDRALLLGQLESIPDDLSELAHFAVGPLCNAIAEDVGEGAAFTVEAFLRTVFKRHLLAPGRAAEKPSEKS